jgi:nitrogenase molybdenum-iron protein alpha/beta subunit
MGVLRMKQCSAILNTYAADVSGVCSALYELGGMIIMDDASGCNSTYNTHDEPRWYSQPSMVYVSALTELQAVMGHDNVLCDEICAAVNELHPRFVAIAGTPIPMMMGTDFAGLARVIEKKCGVPVMGFDTNGMHSYVSGASRALAEFAKRFCKPAANGKGETADANDTAANKTDAGKSCCKAKVNILGATPLDFSVTGNLDSLKTLLIEHGYEIVSTWAMQSSWDELMKASTADVNIVASSCGLELAQYFEKVYGTPYMVGIPTGHSVTGAFFASIDAAFRTHCTQEPLWHEEALLKNGNAADKTIDSYPAYVIGEAVWASCMARALREDFMVPDVRVLCATESGHTVEDTEKLLGPYGKHIVDEDDYFAELKHSPLVLADPLYKYALSPKTKFIPIPHEGYSGRIWRKDIPLVMGKQFDDFIKRFL